MPSCSVKDCRGQRNKNQPRLSIHRFPKSESNRRRWLSGIGGVEYLNPRHKIWYVCSAHFEEKWFNRTLDVLRLRDDAVPSLFMPGNKDSNQKPKTPVLNEIDTKESFILTVFKEGKDDDTDDDSFNLEACRICLATNCKMYSILAHNLDQAYKHLTGIDLMQYKDMNMPEELCVECAHRLNSFSKFRMKSLRAHSLMLEIIEKQNNLTQKPIESIDRKRNNLTSALKVSFKTDYDLVIEHEKEKERDNLTVHELVEIKEEDSVDILFLQEDNLNNVSSGEEDGGIERQEIEFDNIEKEDIMEEVLQGAADKGEIEYVPSELYVRKTKSLARKVKNKAKPKLEENEEIEDYVPSDSESDSSLVLNIAKVKSKSIGRKGRKKIKEQVLEPKIDRRKKPFLNDLNGDLFTIDELSIEEQRAAIEKRQESSNYKHANFRCTECYKGFLDEEAYNAHMNRHTMAYGEYRCSVCKTHFKTKHALRKHISAHHTHRFSCNQCPYVTTHRQTAKLHDRYHKGTKYQCPHCPEEYSNFTTYMGHVRIKHPSDFVCELCGYSFISHKGIALHKKLKHTSEGDKVPDDGPLCELCNIRFLNDEAFKKHLKVSARHKCSDDDSRESNKPKRRSGEKDIAKERNERVVVAKRMYPKQSKPEGPIPCEQCGMQLENSRSYHAHFRRMHPDKNRTKYPSMRKPCMCEVCGRMFQSYALLKDHTWVHTGEKPFKCDQCEKSFRMRQRLVAHRKIHNQVKASYACNLCDKHFSTQSNRQRHMFIHTGLKPFKCEMCGKSFKHVSEKRAHISYVHLKKPWPKRSSRAKRTTSSQQKSVGAVASEIDMQTVWPCDPKMNHINSVMDNSDKPMYYNLKM